MGRTVLAHGFGRPDGSQLATLTTIVFSGSVKRENKDPIMRKLCGRSVPGQITAKMRTRDWRQQVVPF